MNKKHQFTINVIHKALEDLLLEKNYSEISASDIILKSQISRSTFYSHYKSKDDVLLSLCEMIFTHVFSPHLLKESGHDFSSSNSFDYKNIVIHTFCHFEEDKVLFKAILSSESSHIFISKLKENSAPLMNALLPLSKNINNKIPRDIALSIMLSIFTELLTKCVMDAYPPKELASYFFKFLGIE
jgi:AcrR family transcriptional regulator